MAENKKSFLLYADMIHTVRKMPKLKRADLFMTILEYVNDENPIVQDVMVDLVFEPIKRQLKRDLEKYEGKRTKSAEHGILGNLKRWHPDLHKQVVDDQISLEMAEIIAKNRKESPPDRVATNSIANVAVNDTVTVTVNDTVIKKDKSFVDKVDPLKAEYENLEKELEGKELKEVVVALKTFIQKQPGFIEPYKEYWNIFAGHYKLPLVKLLNNSRKKKFATRIREPGFDFTEILDRIKTSPHLKGDNSQRWTVTFDWILENDQNYLKILEGNYN